MKKQKNYFRSLTTRFHCLFTAHQIESSRAREKRLRGKLDHLDGDAARGLLYRMQELNCRAEALELRYARLAEGADRPDRLAI